MNILTNLVCINDGSQQAFTFSSQCRTQALWSTDQKTDYKVGIFFYTFTYEYKSMLMQIYSKTCVFAENSLLQDCYKACVLNSTAMKCTYQLRLD